MPRQDSLTDQIRDLVKLANEHGMYDAADWITARLRETDPHVEAYAKKRLELFAEAIKREDRGV